MTLRFRPSRVQLAGDERQDGPTLVVHAKDLRGSAETDALEMLQKRVNRRRP